MYNTIMNIEKKIEKNTKVQYLTVTEEYSGQRLDNFLITRCKGVPKSRIYRMIRSGEVRINKKRIAPAYRLQAEDSIRIPPLQLGEKAQLIPPSKSTCLILRQRILYEDDYLLILNKPSGIAVHGGSTVRMGVIEILKSMFPKLPHLELVHRLDADTSGCLVVAKKRSVLRELHSLLREGKVHKMYWALTKGQWKPSEYRIEAPLQKYFLQGGERLVKVDPQGKSSLSVFRPIDYFNEATLMEVRLHTGRTHQIRVHAQYAGHPIAGDERYGDQRFNLLLHQIGLRRLFLHAQSIAFTLATSKKHIQVEAPLDEDLKAVLNKLS